jgi:DNA-binding response OmpR family regulator
MAKSARILVVDDERFFRDAISDVFTAAGIEHAAASSGSQALEMATDPSVGVVVLDVEMPGMNGIEVLRRLREFRPELRVVILSAHTDQELVLEALRLGACDYLAKPLHEEELVLAARRALETFGLAIGARGLRKRLHTLQARLAALSAGVPREGGGADAVAAAEAAAAEAVAEVLEATRTSVLRPDPSGERLVAVAGVGHKEASLDPVAVGQGVAGVVFARGETLVVPDVERDPRFASRPERARYSQPSFALAPISVAGRARGVLCATHRRDGVPFNEDDGVLLHILGLEFAQVLENLERAGAPPAELAAAPAPAVDEAAARDAELARLVCEAVVAEVDPDRILANVLRRVAETLDAAPCALYLREPGGEALVQEAAWDGGRREDRPRLESGRGLTGSVFETGRLVATAEPQADPRFDAATDTPASGEALPLLCVPLQFRSRTLGVFRAFPRDPARAAARTGEVLAAALSAAVRNVLLYRSLVQTIEETADARKAAGSRA